jgi:hypothetical protein
MSSDGTLDPRFVPDLATIQMAHEASGKDYGSLGWQRFDVPSGNASIEMKTLSSNANGIVALCRFPAGWRRIQQGYYDIDEVLLYLSGSMTVTVEEVTQTFTAGQYLFRARNDLRNANFTEDGCLTLAWVPRPGLFTDSTVAGPMYNSSRAIGPLPVAESPWAALSSLCDYDSRRV